MRKLQIALAAIAAAGTLSLSVPAPALADSAASTRNVILGLAALAGIAIESNVAHKNAQSRTISGYLPNGSRVYADGHIVAPNGYSYYPQTNNQRVTCSSGSCYLANIDSNGSNTGNFGNNARYGNTGQYGYNGHYGNGQNSAPYDNGQNDYGRNGNGRYDANRDEDERRQRNDGRP